MAELMIGPRVMSYSSEIANKGNPGIIMGMIPISYSLAYQCSGLLSRLVAVTEPAASLNIYGNCSNNTLWRITIKLFITTQTQLMCGGANQNYPHKLYVISHFSSKPYTSALDVIAPLIVVT
ncbi:MAG: hypothetical protein K0S27_241 [Gammaproteobacteria bacterium]|jgi:hypothetical protein|nr:hypothetical protein [Gammaproteobacteria bacterium]